ncbi:MAG: hypothetical protein WCL50_17675 [Spirochaetota bacterium]
MVVSSIAIAGNSGSAGFAAGTSGRGGLGSGASWTVEGSAGKGPSLGRYRQYTLSNPGAISGISRSTWPTGPEGSFNSMLSPPGIDGEGAMLVSILGSGIGTTGTSGCASGLAGLSLSGTTLGKVVIGRSDREAGSGSVRTSIAGEAAGAGMFSGTAGISFGGGSGCGGGGRWAQDEKQRKRHQRRANGR